MMSKKFVAALGLLALCSLAVPFARAATPAPAATQPPEISHTITTPLCSALKTAIGPAIGMMVQNDATIAKSPKLFDEYTSARSSGSDGHADFAVMHLENLVTPLADNVLAIQKLLESPQTFPANPTTQDGIELAKIKAQMFTALASQQASLDIINGFVTTQQLSDMQHEGFGYISALTASDQKTSNNQALTDLVGPTDDPLHPRLFDNTALQAGLAPNPNEIDLTTIPGLQLGYNPLSRLRDGVIWTQGQANKDESTLAQSVTHAVSLCGGQSAASPKP